MDFYIKQEVLNGKRLWPWFVLSFQAGAINTIGYLSCHRFVSHVTGFGTRIGVELGGNNYFMALEMSFKFFFFLFGSILAGVLFYNLKKTEIVKFLFSSMILLSFLIAILFFGELGFFGAFGEPLILARDIILLCLLCFICGLQNGSTSIITHGLMRTTHLTGHTTDLGTGIVKFLMDKSKNEFQLMKIRSLIIISFTLGAAFTAIFAEKLSYKIFLIPIVTSLIIVIYILKLIFNYKTFKDKHFELLA